MAPIQITHRQARRFILAYQGLWPPYELNGKSGILQYIHRVACIQFDPLNIIGRNPEILLQSRIADFQPAMLKELLYQERKLLDGWDKMMSIYPVEDWPFFERRRLAALEKFGQDDHPVSKVLPEVRKALQEQGPLSSIDLKLNERVNWSWAPTRIVRAALESMYYWGELIIHHKVNTRKIYDFASLHLPEKLLSEADPNITEEQFHDWYVLRRLGSVGLLWNRAGDAWIGMPGIKTRERTAALNRLLRSGQVSEIAVEDFETPLYMRSKDEAILQQVLHINDAPKRAAIIAPLDNLLWDRRFVEALFGFRYRWEVYKPAAQREFGYYVLPILYGDRFVARFEPGHDKKKGALIIKNWWWEPDVSPSQDMKGAIADCFQRYLGFLGAKSIQIDQTIAKQSDLDWLLNSSHSPH